MKLIIAIVQDEDASRLVSALMNDGYGVTKLATTGGFLRAGNTTLLVGVDDNRFEGCLHIIEKLCICPLRSLSAGPRCLCSMWSSLPNSKPERNRCA